MPVPTAQQVHIDTALSNVSVAYQNADYIKDQVFPRVPVDHQSDKYYTFSKADFFRSELLVGGTLKTRAPGALAPRGGYRLSNTGYFCNDYAFGKQLPDEVKRNADAALNMEQADTIYVTEQSLLAQEILATQKMFTTGVWATDATPSVLWDVYATSDPISDVRTAAYTIAQNTGASPGRMKLVLGAAVWQKLLDHPAFITRLKITEDRILMMKQVAAILEIGEVLVGRAVYNTAAEGATASMSWVWGKHALLVCTPPAPGLMVPAAGYTFEWGARQVLKYRDAPEGLMADVIEVHDFVDVNVVATDLGYFMPNVTS